jgi:hypothetical protein
VPNPDARRFEILIEPHLDALFRAAYRLARNRADAEDLVQETCVRAYERIAEPRDPPPHSVRNNYTGPGSSSTGTTGLCWRCGPKGNVVSNDKHFLDLKQQNLAWFFKGILSAESYVELIRGSHEIAVREAIARQAKHKES